MEFGNNRPRPPGPDDEQDEEMTRRVRDFDWSTTPLGSRSAWPPSLTTAVQIVLDSPFPQIVLWGPDLIQVYNDGYRKIMGVKHPAGLGQPTRACWPEVWHINESIYRRVFAGESLSFEDALYPITRSGTLEDAWFTLSYSPIRDESGMVAGVLVAVFETTGRIKAEGLTRALVAHLPGAAAFLVAPDGPDLRYRLAEGEALETAGFTPADFVGRTIADVVGPDLAAEYEPRYRGTLERGEPFEQEHNSHGHFYITRGTPLYDTSSGRVEAVLAVSYDITERKRAEEALRESEEKLRLLFDSMDEGFCVMEVVTDEHGKISELYFRQVNQAFEKHTGLSNVVDKTVSELLPNLEQYWIDIYQSVWETGEPTRAENYLADVDRWYRVHYFRVGGVGTPFVGVIFEDITHRKRREEQQQYLLKLSDVLRPLFDPLEVQKAAIRVLGEHLSVDRVFYTERMPDNVTTAISDNYVREGVPKILGNVDTTAFGDVAERLRSGQTVVLTDVNTDAFTEAEKAAYAGNDMVAAVAVPLVKSNAWVGTLVVHSRTARDWTAEEVARVEETAERTWAAVESARTEQALRESEGKYRTLFETMGQGYCELELLRDADGRAVDQRYLNFNPAFERIFGIPVARAQGRTASEVFPDLEPWWTESFDRITRAGTPERIEHEVVSLRRWYAVQVHPRGGDRLMVLYDDITERKRTEADLAFLSEIGKDLAGLTDIDATMDALGAKIAAHFDASVCGFSVIDEAAGTFTTTHAWHRAGAPSFLGTFRIDDYHTEAIRRAMRAGETYAIDDTATDPRTNAANMAALGTGSFVTIPLVRDDQWRFNLTIVDPAPRHWRGDEIELMRELTTRIWARLERARAEAALRESEERFRLLVEGAKDYAMFLLDPQNRISFWSVGAERIFGWSEAEIRGRNGEIIFTPEDREAGVPEKEMTVALTEGRAMDRRWHIRKDGSRFWADGILMRLNDESGTVRGFAKVARDATDQKRAEEATEAALEAVALANEELEQRVEERTVELAEMSQMRQELLRKLVTAQEEERGRISRDLHDDTGQQIAALLLGLNNLKALPAVAAEPRAQVLLPQLEMLAGDVARKSHRLSFTLRPTELDDIGLLGALEHYAEAWSRWSGVPAEVESMGFESAGAGRLPAEIETTIYRVVQEALTNILKHAVNPNIPEEARASLVTVLIQRRATGVQAMVEDDGPGFDVEEALSRPPGQRRLGIFGMQERARLAGGTLEVESKPGEGTTIYLRLPLLPV